MVSDISEGQARRIQWLGDSPERIREFPGAAKHEAGYQRERVQAGKAPADWKPMPSIGLGVNEIRVRESGAFRVIDVAKFSEAVYVLHAFQQKTGRTLLRPSHGGRLQSTNMSFANASDSGDAAA